MKIKEIWYFCSTCHVNPTHATEKIRFIDRRGQKVDSRYWIIELSCHFEKVLLVTVQGTGENSFRWRIFDLSGIRVTGNQL